MLYVKYISMKNWPYKPTQDESELVERLVDVHPDLELARQIYWAQVSDKELLETLYWELNTNLVDIDQLKVFIWDRASQILSSSDDTGLPDQLDSQIIKKNKLKLWRYVLDPELEVLLRSTMPPISNDKDFYPKLEMPEDLGKYSDFPLIRDPIYFDTKMLDSYLQSNLFKYKSNLFNIKQIPHKPMINIMKINNTKDPDSLIQQTDHIVWPLTDISYWEPDDIWFRQTIIETYFKINGVRIYASTREEALAKYRWENPTKFVA